MATYPVRDKLPISHTTEIGRIITRWAFLEWLLRQIAYLLLDLNPKAGRLAVRDPRAGRLRPEPRVLLARCSSATCQFFFGDLSILTVPSRHADAYDLASFRMR